MIMMINENNHQTLVEQGGVQYLLVGNDGQLTPVGRWSAPVQVVLIFSKYQIKMVE